ncbi:MAG TPA: SGNH/GDSL hydrolase family protein [Bryobacteraceae bacterium]|nr:SGNH/GDSL hydrolase family protein [Bryobacteraceae bacterium]
MKFFQTTFTLLSFLIVPAFASDDTNYTYLALGDSVPFGLNITLLPPYSSVTPKPSQFIGYPEGVAAVERLLHPENEVNASCPGETSASFLILPSQSGVPDNGCNSQHLQPPASPIPPFKTIGLHTPYIGTQMEFAEAQLEANKYINLVTLSIGADDVLLVLSSLEQCTDATCVQNVLTPVLQNYAVNLSQVLTRIRAHYQGTLILLTYYSPSPALDGVAVALNGVMTQVAAQLSAQPNFAPIIIADGFRVFKLVSAPFHDDACQAGLLIRLPPSPFTTTPCDIHPSPLGRDLLTATILSVLPR